MKTINRKQFLLESFALSLGLGSSLLLSLTHLQLPKYQPPNQWVPIGKAPDFNLGVHFLSEYQAWLVREPSGFYCVKAFCTHLGCPPKFQNNGFHCHCHGSEFALSGKVLKGPAQQALPRLALTLGPNNMLQVNPSQLLKLEEGEWNDPMAFVSFAI